MSCHVTVFDDLMTFLGKGVQSNCILMPDLEIKSDLLQTWTNVLLLITTASLKPEPGNFSPVHLL